MIRVVFKNLEKSEFVREAAVHRIQSVVDKFPDLRRSRLSITLEMANSPTQPGPDEFRVKVHIGEGRYDGITVEKSASNLYLALADVLEHMLEKLNRHGDRLRVKERQIARRQSKMQARMRGKSEVRERMQRRSRIAPELAEDREYA